MVKLPADFANEVGKMLGLSLKVVEDFFEFEEDKQGYFYARLKPKKFLDKGQFKTMLGEKIKIHRVYSQNPSSLAVVIPKELAKGLGIKNGSYVQIDADEETITIRKVNIGKTE